MAHRDRLQELRNSMEVELMEIEQGGLPRGQGRRMTMMKMGWEGKNPGRMG